MLQKPENEAWWLRAKLYSLYIDKFAGDINGLIERLDYFSELGIDGLHILPHYPSTMTDGGFDITDHTGVRQELGTVEDFKRLCDEAHARGIKIIVDLVLNHTSDQHPWFLEAKASTDNPKRNLYIWSDDDFMADNVPVNFPDFKDGTNWIYNEATDDYYYATFKPTQPELNWQNDQVLEEVLGIAETLISYGVDGFRLDAITHLVEHAETMGIDQAAIHDRVRSLRGRLEDKNPDVVLLGEVIGTTEYSKKYFGDGDECHLAYNFELMSEMFYALLFGGNRNRLQVVIEAAKSIPEGVSWAAFLRNHDALIVNSLGEDRSQELLAEVDGEGEFLFNNGKQTTQRLYNLLGEDEALVREAFYMLYALPSTTVLYYGDEIGMKNAPLPEGEDDTRLISRGQFDWEDAERQMRDPGSLWHHVRRCIKGRT